MRYLQDSLNVGGLVYTDSNNVFTGINTFGDNFFTGRQTFYDGELLLPSTTPDTAGGISLDTAYIIYRTDAHGLDTLVSMRYLQDSLNVGGLVYTDSNNVFTGINTFDDTVKFSFVGDFRDADNLLLPNDQKATYPAGSIWTSTTIETDVAPIVFMSYGASQKDTLATREWVALNYSEESGEAIIDSMHLRTSRLDLDYWGSAATNDSSWRAQIDSNTLKIDDATYYLDPLAFYLSSTQDSLFLDFDYLISQLPDSLMEKTYYDPLNIQEQLVGITAFQELTNKTVNGVTLVSGGASDQFLSKDGNYYTPAGTGTGEANVGSNLGTGEGLYTEKTGVALRFKSLKGANGISISADATSITMSGASNLAYTDTDNNFSVKQTGTIFELDDKLLVYGLGGVLMAEFNSEGEGYVKEAFDSDGTINAASGYEVNGVEFVDYERNGDFETITTDADFNNVFNVSISGTATLDVTDKKVINISSYGGTITNFTSSAPSTEAHEIILYVSSGTSLTIQNNANIHLPSRANITLETYDVIKLMKTPIGWVRSGGSDN
jgi:hypothetical protein